MDSLIHIINNSVEYILELLLKSFYNIYYKILVYIKYVEYTFIFIA